MKKIKIFLRSYCCITFLACTSLTYSQDQSSPYDVKPVNAKYSFAYNQVPDNLIPIYPTYTGTSYQWEQSTAPTAGFTSISGATQATYTFSAPLSQTTYFRRRVVVNSANVYSNIIRIDVVSVNWESINYIREHDVLVAGITTWQGTDQLPIGQKLQTTTYLDGLGRPVQKISKETATPTQSNNLWGDVVQFIKYDAFGRTPTQHLPYTTTTESGKYKTTPLTEQPQYYTNAYNETSAFSTATYDNSPLNRITNIKSPGTSWAASAGNSVQYDLNEAAENVRLFTIGYTTGDVPVSSGAYALNTLFKTSHVDENGKKVIEYTNNSGQLILTKVQLDNNPSVAHDGWICTYNIYDDFGQLRFRLQPEAIKWLDANGWSFAGANGQQVLNELCFRYEYDEKGRNILKKAPGAKELYMLYDQRDRVVFMQDGNQRAKSPDEWTANLYDELDRPVITTLYATNKTVAQLQSDINNAITVTNVNVNNPGSPISDLIINTRDQGISNYKAQNSIEFISDFESAANDAFLAEIDPNAVNLPVNLTTSAYKSPISNTDLNNSAVNTIVKYYFYDNYTYGGAKSFNSSFDNNLAYTTGEPITPTQRTINMVTGTIVRVLGTNAFLTSTMYYDDKGRAIQTLEDNIKSGQDITTLQYQFDGRVLSTNTKHTAVGTGYSSYSIVSKSIFDKIGRVIGVEKKYGSNNFKAVASYDYDDIGRLKNKHLDPGYTGSGKNELEGLAYSFNIHNEITGINKDYALKSGTYDKWSKFFGLYLGFDNRDNVFANSKLNGQVTGVLWNTQGDDAQRKYDFTYDNAGRLVNAQFNEKKSSGDNWSHATMDFSVTGNNGKVGYDLNGNLLSMLQKGVLPGSASPVNIDDLQYTYASLSNKLSKVVDNSTLGAVNGKLGDFSDGSNGSNDDYIYDDNGNLVIDLNKNAKELGGLPGANGIRYNFLDKPEEIRIAGKGTIKIVYDANGNKLQKIYTPESGTAVTTIYINEFVYRGNDLQYINFEEGRIRVIQPVSQNNGYDLLTLDGNMDLPGGKKGAYDYFIRDYQSNVRMILTEEMHVGSNSCTMETARSSGEEAIFGQVDVNGIPTNDNEVRGRFAISGIPGQSSGGGWQSNTSSYVSRIGAFAGKKVGPNTLQKVMAGDLISATTIYYYQNPVTNQSSVTTLTSDLLLSLGQAIAGGGATGAVAKGAAGNIASSLGSSIPFASAIAPDASNASGNNPKAYLNVVFFDERFNFVTDGSASLRVSQSGSGASPLVLANIKAPKNGYAFVYVSNESNEMVYFDDLQVSNNHGRIIEENHYYAYGLRIAGISSRKVQDVNEGLVQNNYQFQGDYSEMDEDIGWNDFVLRNYDAQIGRWVQQDPYDEFPSPYVGMGNDPVNNIDPSGGNIFDGLSFGGRLAVGAVGGAVVGGVIGMVAGDGWKGFGIGAAVGLAAASGSWRVATSVAINSANTTATILRSTTITTSVGTMAHGPNAGDINIEEFFQTSSNWTAGDLMNLVKNGLRGRLDRNRNGALSCLNAFASNLKVLYGTDGPDNYPTNGNMSTAVAPLVELGLASHKFSVQPKVDGKALSSRSHNGSEYYDGDHFKGVIGNNILETINNMTKVNGIGIFALGIAAEYHSTIIAVVKDPKVKMRGVNGVSFQGSNDNPFYLFIEDSRGALIGSGAGINMVINPYITGARAFYRGDLNPGGRGFSNTSGNMSLASSIYQLFK